MSSTAKIKRQERADRLMNNIPWFRLKMGDIFRSMVMPIAILTFLSIVYGVLDSVQRNITIKNTTISNNITYAKLIFEKLIGFVPMITAISVATTFSSNRTLGAITTFIGWVCFIAIQSVFIKFNGTSYEFLGIKTLKNIIGTNSINRLEIPGLSQSIIYVNSNMIVGFLVGYVNALILSKISKRVSSLTNITFIALVIAIALSMALGVLHSLTIISLTKGLEQSKDIFTGSKLSKNSLNHFLGVLITSAIYPMQLQGLTENLYSPIMNPYYKIILALFVLPLVALVLVNNAKKGNKKFAFSLYLTAIIASVALGQYQPILLTIFFASPLLFLIIGAALPAFASWIIAYVGVGISANPIKSGDLVDFIRNFIIPFIKKDAAYKKAWIILIIGAVAEVVAALIAHFYIKYTKVCVLGKANVVKKMFAYEYITENNYVVFAKYHDKDVRNPIRHQVADEMLNKASLLLEKENIDAANGLSDSAHKMGYTKEVSINSEGEGFEVGKYKVDDQPTALNDLNVDDLFNSPIEKGLLEAPLLDLNIPNQETTTLNNLNVMNEGLEDISDFNEFTSPESPEQYNSIFMPQSFEYTTELTPDVDSPLNIQEATLSQPSFEPINNNVQQMDSTNFDEQNFDVQNLDESMFESSNQPYDLETPIDNLMLEPNINPEETSSDELSEQEIPTDSIDYDFGDLNISEENSDLSDLDNEEEYVLEDENTIKNDEVIVEENPSTKESEELVEVENENPIQFMTSEEQHSVSNESNDDSETKALKRRIAELEAEKNAIQPTYVETIKFIGEESFGEKSDLDSKQLESPISVENQQENIDNSSNDEQINQLEKQIAELIEQLNNKQQQVQPTYVETIKYLDNPSVQNKQPEYIYNFNEEKTVPLEQSDLVYQEEDKEIQPVVKEEHKVINSQDIEKTVEQIVDIIELKNKESKSEFEKTMLMEFASMNEKLSNLIYAMSQQNSGKPVINIINKIDRSLLGSEHTEGIENRNNETIYQEVSGQEISTYDESELPNNNQMISYDFEGNQQDLTNYSNDFENQQFDNVNFDNFQFDENGQIEEGLLPVEDNQELNSNVDFGNIDFDSLSFDDSLNLNYIPENNEEKVEESSNNNEQLELLDESQTSDSDEQIKNDENIVETSSASEEQNEDNDKEFDFSNLDNFEDELTKEMTLEEENGVINNNENISINNDEASNNDEQLELLDESQTSDSNEKTNSDENIENDNLDISQEFSDLSKDDLINNDELSDEPLELADAETIEAEEELQELDSFDMDEDEANSLANISSGLSFDEEANDEQSLTSEGLTSEENIDVVKQKMFSFETKIKHFMILSPLLGEIISQTPTSIEVLSSSGKLIMPNDAVVEYISENRDKYIVNIYGVKMEVLMNAPLEKTHKQRLHNKIYANEGKKLYKGDFFLDGNKKYYSENGDQMILTFRILPGNYDVYAIRHMNKKLSKWDGIFEISLNKSFDTKSRTAHVVEDDTKEN